MIIAVKVREDANYDLNYPNISILTILYFNFFIIKCDVYLSIFTVNVHVISIS